MGKKHPKNTHIKKQQNKISWLSSFDWIPIFFSFTTYQNVCFKLVGHYYFVWSLVYSIMFGFCVLASHCNIYSYLNNVWAHFSLKFSNVCSYFGGSESNSFSLANIWNQYDSSYLILHLSSSELYKVRGIQILKQ